MANGPGFLSQATGFFTGNNNPAAVPSQHSATDNPNHPGSTQEDKPKREEDENNGSVNDDLAAQLWGQEGEEDQEIDPTNKGDDLDPQKQVKDFVDSLGLSDIEFTEKDLEHIQSAEGMAEALNMLNKRMANAMLKGIKAMNTIVDRKLEEATQNAVSLSERSQTVKTFRKNFTADMPDIANDPVLMPIVETAAGRLYKAGLNDDDVMAGVKKLIGRFAEKGGEEPKTDFSTGGRYSGGGKDDRDWLKFLTEG